MGQKINPNSEDGHINLDRTCSHRLPGFDKENPRAAIKLPVTVSLEDHRISSSLSIPVKPILVVGDHLENRRQWSKFIEEARHTTHDCSCDSLIAISKTNASGFSLLILDMDNLSPELTEHTPHFRQVFHNIPVIFIGTKYLNQKEYRIDYPEYLIGCLPNFSPSVLLPLIDTGLRIYKTVQEKTAFSNSFGFLNVPMKLGERTDAIRHLNKRAVELASQDGPVLIEAEPGCRADIVALLIHNGSVRKSAPFGMVDVHFGFRELYETRLFGIEAGTYELYPDGMVGQIELMNRGSILIDNIHCMFRPTQDRLLSYLKTRTIFRINSFDPRICDTRVFVASVDNLERLVEENSFSKELLEMFADSTIRIPPLREHRDAIHEWIDVFSQWIAEPSADMEPPRFTAAAVEKMMQYAWPGNTDEFIQVMRRLVYSCKTGIVNAEDVVFNTEKAVHAKGGAIPFVGITLEEMEKRFIQETLKAQQGNKAATARMLGITEKTLYNKLRKYDNPD